jgi:TPR repeat protein
MPNQLITCVSLPPATLSSVPVNDFVDANEKLATVQMEQYFTCCGKGICGGCIHSFGKSGNMKCPFCNAEGRGRKTDDEIVEELMRRVVANDAGAMYVLGSHYYSGDGGLEQDHAKAMVLYARAAELGYSKAHYRLGDIYRKRGDITKAKFHYEAAAMAGHEKARYFLGGIEAASGNSEKAMKHFSIAASAGSSDAMYTLQQVFESGHVNRDAIDSTLIAYNNSCAEMRSKARDAYIRWYIGRTGER